MSHGKGRAALTGPTNSTQANELAATSHPAATATVAFNQEAVRLPSRASQPFGSADRRWGEHCCERWNGQSGFSVGENHHGFSVHSADRLGVRFWNRFAVRCASPRKKGDTGACYRWNLHQWNPYRSHGYQHSGVDEGSSASQGDEAEAKQ